jgi:hypothetical protein
MKRKIYEVVFKKGLKDLNNMIGSFVSEEKTKHESLKKYSKENN